MPRLCRAIVSLIPPSLPSDLTDQVAGAAEVPGSWGTAPTPCSSSPPCLVI